MRRGRGVAGLLLGVSLTSGLGAAWSGGAFASARPIATSAPLPTAVLAPRRAAAALVDFVARTRLAMRLDRFVDGVPGRACLAVQAAGRDVFSHDEEKALIPASTMKLLTARAAIRHLAPRDFATAVPFRTTVRGRQPDDAGVVTGDIVLEGGGDPLLSTRDYAASLKHPLTKFTDLDELVTRVTRAGVRHITGRVVGADARFDEERFVPTWKPNYARDGDVGPIGALALNDGYVSFGPRPVPANDPALAAAERFRAALVAGGVVVDGAAASDDDVHADKALATLASQDFPTIVRELLSESDNNTAEILLKHLAATPGGPRASRIHGLEILRTELAAEGLPVADLVANDGSGLDREDRVTCRLLLGTLRPIPGFGDVDTLLSVAASDGTLAERFRGHPLAGKLAAKTGSLDGVVGLVGVSNRAVASSPRFAFLANGSFSEGAGRELQERLGRVLATYPEAPTPASLTP